MKNNLFEFFSYGIMTPMIYLTYSVAAILFTFIFGLPFAIGIHLINMATNIIFEQLNK